ncbi:hypothetical protein Scep_001856 [Stephania cephalantha]|uniref:Reverse transcriptase Ty1/copia-type domain-containing protein n=1 Tax=Stephania cephalantha TaxID=152367 RepID=A0AAP0LBK8_9MAGN
MHNIHPMITRSKNDIFKRKALVSTNFNVVEDIPKNAEQALQIPKSKDAIELEYKALLRTGTWSLVPFSSQQVGNKWIFSIKRNSDGSINRYKSRLVAQGFKQMPGIDFGEPNILVVKSATIHIFLSLAVKFGWSLRQLDINNAFLNGNLVEDVFTNQPRGFVSLGFPNHVCKLHKVLYGLKQAPRAWFDQLKSTLVSWGFQNSKADNSLFFHHVGNSELFILVYMDEYCDGV